MFIAVEGLYIKTWKVNTIISSITWFRIIFKETVWNLFEKINFGEPEANCILLLGQRIIPQVYLHNNVQTLYKVFNIVSKT